MNLALVETTIRGDDVRVCSARLRAVLNDVEELTSRGKRVLLHLDSSLGDDHLSKARTYSKNIRDIKEQIRYANGKLLIALLRSANVPTHSEPLADKKGAATCLVRMKYAKACVF
jgi:hypothetical protein